MKIDDQFVSLSKDELSEFERGYGFSLPEEIKEFYLKFNGGVPDKSFYPATDEFDYIELSRFLYFDKEKSRPNSIEGVIENGIGKGFLYAGVFPFARDFGGNFICWSEDYGVFYLPIDCFDMEFSSKEDIRKHHIPLASNFNEFIGLLTIEDEAY